MSSYMNHNSNNHRHTYNTPHEEPVELPLLDKVNHTSNYTFPCAFPAKPPHYNPPHICKRQKRHFYQHVPLFTTPSALTRHDYIKDAMQPGSLVQFYGNSEVLKCFQLAKWEPVVFYRNKFVCPTLIKEFYCNLNVGFGLRGAYFITTVLNGTPVLVDHIVISRALNFHPKVAEQMPLDITKEFKFDKNEYQLYLGTFCDCDIPAGMFETDEPIPYEHFLPKYQVLALIVRENILPKPNHDKMFGFIDLKVMFCLINDRVDFSLSYVILLNMIHAVQMNFMPYGMLLNGIFSFLKIDVNMFPSKRVSALIFEKASRKQIPLSEFVSVINPALKLPAYIASHTQLVVKVDNLEKSIGVDLTEMKGMHMRGQYRVNHMLKLMDNAMARIKMLEQNNDSMFDMIKKLIGNNYGVVPRASSSGVRAFSGVVVDLESGDQMETGSEHDEMV